MSVPNPMYPLKCKNCPEDIDCLAFDLKCEVCEKEGFVMCFEISFIAKGCRETGGDIDKVFCPECSDKFEETWYTDNHHCRNADDVLALKNYIRTMLD